MVTFSRRTREEKLIEIGAYVQVHIHLYRTRTEEKALSVIPLYGEIKNQILWSQLMACAYSTRVFMVFECLHDNFDLSSKKEKRNVCARCTLRHNFDF